MPFVIDASITACWALEDQNDSRAELAFERLHDDEARAPGLWWFEVRNVLIMNERRGRITEADTASFLRNLARLPITIDHAPVEADLMRIAREHGLTAYDAAYVELACREGTALATLDERLARAAAARGVLLL